MSKSGVSAQGRTSMIVIALILIATIVVAFTVVLHAPHSTSSTTVSTTTANGFISILSGSGNFGTLITFSPQNVTVVIGQNNTVMWTNNDQVDHTVTSQSIPAGAKSFNSGLLSPGETFTYTFGVTGIYYYICTLHTWMHGTVTVVSTV